MTRRVLLTATLFLTLVGRAAAQDSNDIMGFEVIAGWTVTGSSAPPGFMVTSTPIRTQGNAAYAVANPPNQVRLVSRPVSSSATAVMGIGEIGALLRVDVLVPVQQGNAINAGSIQAFVTSRARGLRKVELGQIPFAGSRPGIYNTVGFSVPDQVRAALGGATFDDLIFELDINSPGRITGTYLLDNLRVHSANLVTVDANTQPPPGYGGSVDLVATDAIPAVASFSAQAVQVPESFRLKLGSAGASTVTLEIGYDGVPSFACTYGPDPSDSSGRAYLVTSCAGGTQAGDVVGASWVRLAISGGAGTMKLRAQLAANPVGDAVGGGIIPPMPTFWGDFDGCIPSPVAGTVVTTSSVCASQTAQASQIVTEYFNRVENSNSPPNWIVTPAPEFAGRHGDASPHNNLTGPPAVPLDPPFDQEGHMNEGGDWDAYWIVSGNFTPNNYAGTDRSTNHFDATFGAHAVVWGYDVDIASIQTLADTDTGETTPGSIPPSSSASVHMYVLGTEIPAGGFNADASGKLTAQKYLDQKQDIAYVGIWVFGVTLGVDAYIGVAASGNVTPSHLYLEAKPYGGIGAYVKGGVNVGVASGSVNANVNLINVQTPLKAQATWNINTDPKVCRTALDYSTTGDATISSAGGSVDLEVTFGICPLCHDDSWEIFHWKPLSSFTQNLFNFSDTHHYPIPVSLCTPTLQVKIVSPTANASVPASIPVQLDGEAYIGLPPICDGLTWSFTPGPGATTVSPSTATGCKPVVTFGPPASGYSSAAWTINLNATVTFTNEFGNITVSGAATPVPITVTNIPAGVYITALTNPFGTINLCSALPCTTEIMLPLGETVVLQGLVVGASDTPVTTFTVTDPQGVTTVLSTVYANMDYTKPSSSGFTPTGEGTYKFTMTTTVNGITFGSAELNVISFVVK